MDSRSASLEDVREIRRLMEKSSRFLSLSGLAGVLAGIAALLGAVIFYGYAGMGRISYDDHTRILNFTGDKNLTRFLVTDGLIVLCIALFTGYYFSRRRARKMGIKFWNPAAKKMIINLFIPLVAGGLVILVFLLRSQVNYVASFTLIFYGLGLVNAGKYSYADINYLGLCEIVLGIFALVFINHGLIFWTIGFGIFHIIYGMILYYKYERHPQTR